MNKENYKVLDQLVQFNYIYNEKEIRDETEKNSILNNVNQDIKDAIVYCNLIFGVNLNL